MSNIWNAPPFGAAAILQSGTYWHFVRRRFRSLVGNLELTADQLKDGRTKYRGVVNVLNRHYWDIASETAHHELCGSWAKGTRVRPPRDIDMIFELPFSVYQRFELRSGNRQSQLLQEVRDQPGFHRAQQSC